MPAPRPARAGLRASLGFAVEGLFHAARERNMRIHLVAGLLVGLAGSAVPLGPAEQLALLMAVALVIAAEAANTALEGLVDLCASGHDERARIAKDAAAGAVLVLSLGAVAVLATVLVRDWPLLAAEREALGRQALAGGPLALAAAALLAGWARSRAVDAALGIAGAGLLALLGTWSRSAVFTGLTALIFAFAVAVAFRRR